MKQLFKMQLPPDVAKVIDDLVTQVGILTKELEEVKQLMAISEADFRLVQGKVEVIEEQIVEVLDAISTIKNKY